MQFMIKNNSFLVNFSFRLKNYLTEHFFNYPPLFVYYPFCSRYFNNIRIKFWCKLLKKNLNFNKFFYEDCVLNLDDALNELRKSGIVIIPNFLPKNILEDFVYKINNSVEYVDYKLSESTDANLLRTPLKEYPFLYDFINFSFWTLYTLFGVFDHPL